MKYKASVWVPLLLGLVLRFSLLTPALAAPPSSAPAAPSTSGVIQTLEDSLYAARYEGESPESRVSRLETTVFGQPQANLSLDARVAKLKAVLAPSGLAPLSAFPRTTSGASNQSTTVQTPATARTPGSTSKTGAMPSLRPPQPGVAPSQPSPFQTFPSATAQSQPIPGETDYPAVSLMEKRLFAKTFEREDITRRLARLEKEVFKVPQSGALVDRVDHLRTVVLGDTTDGDLSPVAGGLRSAAAPPPADPLTGWPGAGGQPAAPYSPPPIQWTPPANAPMPGYNDPSGGFSTYSSSQTSTSGPLAYGSSSSSYNTSYNMSRIPAAGGGALSPDMLTALNEVEKEVLGNTHPSEPVTSRLDRLETKVFNTTSPEMPPEDRMQRVIAVASAGGAPQSPQARAKSTFQALLPIILTILPMLLL
jgi:hypothetical protein